MDRETARASGLLDARETGQQRSSFTLQNRIARTLFGVVWKVGAAWTPPPLHAWRCAILRAFGARIGRGVRLYGSVQIWLPANLTVDEGAIIGPRVTLYNQGHITIGSGAIISQGAHICASTHDVNDRHFQLVLRPIRIEPNAWVAAEAFVGPGVVIGEGAVLGARGAAFRDLDAWTIYSGNPASAQKTRTFRD